MSEFDWKALETTLGDAFLAALDGVDGPVYALALHGVYRELDGPLTLPLLAVGVEGPDTPAPDGDFWGARFNPADLTEPEREAPDPAALLTLERGLIAEATRADPAHWRAVEARALAAYLRVAARLRDEAPDHVEVTDELVAFLFLPEAGPATAARTIDPDRFARLFPKQIERENSLDEVRAMAPAERAAYLVTRFGVYEGVTSEDAQRLLLALHEDAVDALCAALPDAHGWTAAKLLGQIGVARPNVIGALRARADAHWFAKALGLLGDHAWLAAQPATIAANGLTAPLLAITGASRPLDYRPLEGWLARADEDAAARVEKEIAPGRSYATIAPGDVDEALRGLRSDHPAVRWHACAVLGDRGLGESAGARILPAIVERLADPHPFVRRLAVLSVDRWKAQGRPHRAAIEPLRDDPDEVVRRVVEAVLDR